MTERGRLSELQIAIKGHLEQAGHGYHCGSDYRDVVDAEGLGRAAIGHSRAVTTFVAQIPLASILREY